MPYPSEHAARVKEPGAFDQTSFRSKNLKPGIRIIVGKLKGDDAMTVQAYRFSVSKYTPEQAKKWLKDHNVSYVSFEPAKSEPVIKHFGIPGMRWHHRKSSGETSEDHKKASSLKKKKLSEMSNEELRAYVTRLQLEKQYKDINQSAVSKGKKVVAEVLANAAKESAKKYVSSQMDDGLAKLIAAAKGFVK